VEVLAAEVTSVPLPPAFTTDLVPFTPVLLPNLFLAKTLGAVEEYGGVKPAERLGRVTEVSSASITAGVKAINAGGVGETAGRCRRGQDNEKYTRNMFRRVRVLIETGP
jgi:hypothetical protein